MKRLFLLCPFWLLIALHVGACAEPEPNDSPEGTPCGSYQRQCSAREVCSFFADEFACMPRCVLTSECGAGACCSHREQYVDAYCVPLGDPLHRDGASCLP